MESPCRKWSLGKEGGSHSSPLLLDGSVSSHLGLMPPAFPSTLLLTKYSITTTGKELENTDSAL